MASCQAAAALQALQHNYEQSRQRYLQQLLDIAQSLGELMRFAIVIIQNIGSSYIGKA